MGDVRVIKADQVGWRERARPQEGLSFLAYLSGAPKQELTGTVLGGPGHFLDPRESSIYLERWERGRSCFQQLELLSSLSFLASSCSPGTLATPPELTVSSD